MAPRKLPSIRRRAAPSRRAGPRLGRVLAGLAQQAMGDVKALDHRFGIAVHALRRRMKKLQSLMLLAEGCFDRSTLGKVNEAIDRLKKAFASDRDAKVVHSIAFEMGGRRLAQRMAPRPEPPATITASLNLAKDLVREVSKGTFDRLSCAAIHECHGEAAKTLRRLWKKAHHDPSAKRLHAYRKQAKICYFQLLFVRLLKGHQKKKLKHIHHLGHCLGGHHDMHMFEKALCQRDLLTDKRKKAIQDHQKELCKSAFHTSRKLFKHA